ncbi:hypothetical protein [Microbulbifer sp. YPW16]|uniref:hypothetical protein n=1 Tax=unclassified Microbulbifer TaxID=2619833 RepID=UPI001E3A4412|nr:hypothetical protein [Microbulbifer sp. YPW16]UHQ57004.1 hypothetical protein LVE68_08500 [Microbulbifer sp. YPW16]
MKYFVSSLLFALPSIALALEGIWFSYYNFKADGSFKPLIIVDLRTEEIRLSEKINKSIFPGEKQHPDRSDRISAFLRQVDSAEDNTFIYSYGTDDKMKFYRAVPVIEANAEKYLEGVWAWQPKKCDTEYFSYDFESHQAKYNSNKLGDEVLRFEVKGDTYREWTENSLNLIKMYYIPETDWHVSILKFATHDGDVVFDKNPDDLDMWHHFWYHRCEE